MHIATGRITGLLRTALAGMVWVGVTLPAGAADATGPSLLLHHSFDAALERADFAAAPVRATVADAIATRPAGVYGAGVAFPAGARGATVRLDLESPAPASGWTIALFNQLVAKEVLTAPERPLLTVLDETGKPLLTMDVSGLVKVVDAEGVELAALDCFDALYWIGGENIHLALVFDADGAEGGAPRGKLTSFWAARPYGCAYVDLGERRPAAIILGGDDVGGAVDELHVFDGSLPMRAIHELARPPRQDVATLRTRIPEIVASEAARPDAVRRAAWRALTRAGLVIEAEAGQNADVVVSGKDTVSASGRACLKTGGEPTHITLTVPQAGDYALALRYALGRQVDPLWPVRHPEAKTAWTHNHTTVKALLDGNEIGTARLYPTGTYNGHRGDVEPWAWITLAEKLTLPAGGHTLELRWQDGLDKPLLDAVLLSASPGPAPPHPRWVDQYRIPPAWWIAGKKTETRQPLSGGAERIDTYTVQVRNRTDEPYAATVELGHDMLGAGQTVSTETTRIDLAPFAEQTFEVVFRTPADQAGSSGYVRVTLWNEDVALPQEYRIWNFLPRAEFATQTHPALVPVPDPAMQAAFRAWLETRDEAALTPELRKWAAGPDKDLAAPEYKALQRGAKVKLQMFRKPLLGAQLGKLDFWMSMTPEQFARFLPDAAAEDHGYGSTWDKVNNTLTGVWHGGARILATVPPMAVIGLDGDLDLVTELTAEGDDFQALRQRKETITKTGTWTREKDADVFLALRLIRAGLPVGVGPATPVAHEWRDAGLWILAEAYHLTGDPRYAQQAAALATVYARKFTFRTKQFFSGLNREDRDWWGTRLGNRYAWSHSVGGNAMMATILLDLCRTALDGQQLAVLEHNLVRWAMHEVSSGAMWDDPDKMMKVNREDMPAFIAFAKSVGDAAPYRSLDDYRDKVNLMVLEDGVHACSIGSYGGVGTYIGFMQRLASLGVDVVTGNPRLRHAFLAQTRFMFSCGSIQPMDDGGGGQNLLGLGAGFGMPSAEQYAWGHELYGDPLFTTAPPFVAAVGKATRGGPVERTRAMSAFYAPDPDGQPAGAAAFPMREIWPDVHVAEVKGLAMLRHRVAPDPRDWIEVIFDYGRYGARFHGHPSKLAILTAYNGQIGSNDHGDSLRNDPSGGNAFLMGGYAHNTVQVNYKPHRTAGGPVPIGELIAAGGDEAVQWIDADSDRMFDGVTMRRTTFVTAAGIVDFYLCRSDTEHVYDWPYHNFGIAETAVALTPTDVSKQGLLRFASGARAGAADGLIQVTWKDQPLAGNPPPKGSTSLIDEEVFARLWAMPEAGTELILFAGPTPAPLIAERELDYVLLRRRAASTVFATVIEPWRASTGPKIEAVEKVPVFVNGQAVPDTDAGAMKVTRVDGKVQVFLVNYSGGEKTVGTVTTVAKNASWTLGADGQAVDLRDSAQARF